MYFFRSGFVARGMEQSKGRQREAEGEEEEGGRQLEVGVKELKGDRQREGEEEEDFV